MQPTSLTCTWPRWCGARKAGHHSCVCFAGGCRRYVTSLSFLANTNSDTNPQHTSETVFAMCLMSHWPLFSFQAHLLRYLFAHLYDSQANSNLLSPSFADVAAVRRCAFVSLCVVFRPVCQSTCLFPPMVLLDRVRRQCSLTVTLRNRQAKRVVRRRCERSSHRYVITHVNTIECLSIHLARPRVMCCRSSSDNKQKTWRLICSRTSRVTRGRRRLA